MSYSWSPSFYVDKVFPVCTKKGHKRVCKLRKCNKEKLARSICY